jgi:hypothetical protein
MVFQLNEFLVAGIPILATASTNNYSIYPPLYNTDPDSLLIMNY